MLHRPERNVASDQIPPAPILKAPEDPTADPRGAVLCTAWLLVSSAVAYRLTRRHDPRFDEPAQAPAGSIGEPPHRDSRWRGDRCLVRRRPRRRPERAGAAWPQGASETQPDPGQVAGQGGICGDDHRSPGPRQLHGRFRRRRLRGPPRRRRRGRVPRGPPSPAGR